MKSLKYILGMALLMSIIVACQKIEDRVYNFDYITAPDKVSAVFDITQDNTGLVTVVPTAEGAQRFHILFGDVENEEPTEVPQGESVEHIYSEGQYSVKITAIGLSNKSTSIEEQINVSFKAPENLVVNIESDKAVSYTVNLSATADYTTMFDIYFGESVDEEAVKILPEEVVSYTYAQAGTYQIKVVAKGGAIATLEETFTFEATKVEVPAEAAPTPPSRSASSVVSIFSDAYTNQENTDFNPDWGQSTVVSTEDIGGSSTLKYGNLNYQGTQLYPEVDLSKMQFMHIDVWTADADQLSIFPISIATGEKNVDLALSKGEWLSYDIPMSDFSDQGLALNDIHQLKITGTEGSTVYLDNIYFYKEGGLPTLPLDFESNVLDYTFVDFDGGVAEVIDNPQSSGINTSSKVTRMVKNPGQVWGGSYLSLDGPIDFSASKTFKMKAYSIKAGTKVLLKVENKDDSSVNFEKEVTMTKVNEWEELSFDYSAIDDSKSYHNIVIIFDLGTQGDGTANYTFYFDDISLGDLPPPSGGDELVIPVDFESETITYAFTDFDGGVATVIDNPQSSGINTSSKVGQMVKNGGQPWGGSYLSFTEGIDFSSNKTFKMKVYSIKAGTKVLLKVENKDDSSVNFEKEVTMTKVNEWEELSFDYSAIDASKAYHNMVLIFDLGTQGDGSAEMTYLFDDITLMN